MSSVVILGVSTASIVSLIGIFVYIKHIKSKLRRHIFRNEKFQEYFKKL